MTDRDIARRGCGIDLAGIARVLHLPVDYAAEVVTRRADFPAPVAAGLWDRAAVLRWALAPAWSPGRSLGATHFPGQPGAGPRIGEPPREAPAGLQERQLRRLRGQHSANASAASADRYAPP